MIIENGTLIDPWKQTKKIGNLYIEKDKIVKGPTNCMQAECKQRVDAKGHYVMPGLIENHTHIYYGGGDTNLNPDVVMLPSGVTSAIDQGSSGWSNFEAFYRNTMQNSMMNIKCYLNVSNTGIITEEFFENIDPNYFNKEMIKFYCERYQDSILGLKIRLCRDSVKDMGLRPLEKAIEIGEELKLPLSVHIKDMDCLEDIAKLLRKGDTWVHMYQLSGQTIMDDRGKIRKEIRKAKERGVLFDVASGRSSFSFDLMEKSLKQGFTPDFLGTDLVTYNVYQRPMFSLPYAISIYLNFGFTMEEIAKICISQPAKTMGQSGEIDTLSPQTIADICIMEVKETSIDFYDRHGGSWKGNQLLIPKMTIKDGKVVYRNIEF